MRLVRLAVANVDTTVGALEGNLARAVAAARTASEDGASIVAFPEQLFSGYPPEDLVQWRGFVGAQWKALHAFAKATASLGCASAVGVTVARGAHLYNCAALVHAGRIHGLVPKEKLPTYNVFYEGRTLARGVPGLQDELGGIPFGDLVFALDFGRVALEVCEDLWSPDGPMRRRCYAGAELVVNISASPFRFGVVETRREMISTRSADNQATLVYANLVGANDGLVFDGGGLVAQNGRMLHEAPRFREGVSAVTVDLDRTRRLRAEITTWRQDQEAFVKASGVRVVDVPEPTRGRDKLAYPVPAHGSFFLPPPERSDELVRAADRFFQDLLDALALGVGDYFEKTGAFETIGVALSGGRDSLLCLIVARHWIERRFADLSPEARKAKARKVLRAFFMPTHFTSPETTAAARRTAEDLDAPLVVLSIEEAFAKEVEAAQKMLQPGETMSAMAKQNVQARLRAERMWTWANSARGLFLQTSNMSEKAVGYSTIGGDSEGALSVIANVPKTVVNALLEWLREKYGWPCIDLTLRKPPSAELAEDQEDERDLMPFPVLDACFALYAGEKMSPDEVHAVLCVMFPEHGTEKLQAWTTRFARLFTASIYKWVQAPLALHVGNLDLDRERALQLPVVQKTEWQG